jgi:serine/threonine-protein kinase
MGTPAKKIGKYVLYEQIAKGGMAELYRGKVVGAGGFEKRVALKRILPDLAHSEEFQRMFLAEAKVMASLVHSNIVQVVDFFRDGQDVYLVQEYIFGKNLRQILKKTQEQGKLIPIPVVLHVVMEVAKGLDYAHRKMDEASGKPLGLVHRDVSPQNIMVSYDGDVKIVDFGIVKLAISTEKTATGVLKGKFGYMSPEQIEGLEIDQRSDIFSLGVVLVEALTGQKLFQAETEVQYVKLIQSFQLPRISMLRPEVTVELEEVAHKALEKDRSRRYLSAQHLLLEVSKVLQQSYGGAHSVLCAEFLRSLFAQEYAEELEQMQSPVEVYEQGAELRATGTEAGAGRRGPLATHVGKASEPTQRKPHPLRDLSAGGWHELKHKSGIRFRIKLDPQKPWPSSSVQAAPSQGESGEGRASGEPSPKATAGTASASGSELPSKSIFLRWWRNPRARRLLILGGLLLLLLWLLAKPVSESPKSPDVPPPGVSTEPRNPTSDEGGDGDSGGPYELPEDAPLGEPGPPPEPDLPEPGDPL